MNQSEYNSLNYCYNNKNLRNIHKNQKKIILKFNIHYEYEKTCYVELVIEDNLRLRDVISLLYKKNKIYSDDPDQLNIIEHTDNQEDKPSPNSSNIKIDSAYKIKDKLTKFSEDYRDPKIIHKNINPLDSKNKNFEFMNTKPM